MGDLSLIRALMPDGYQDSQELERQILNSQNDPRYQFVSEQPEISLEDAYTVGGLGLDFTPVLGDLKSLYDAYDEAQQGNYGWAAFNAAGALPLVPSLAPYVKTAAAFGGAGLLAKEMSRLDEAGKLANIFDLKIKQEPNYLYHATNAERAEQIAQEGLIPHKPFEFTDQEMWPDESIDPRIYFSRKADIVSSFAPEEGIPVAIRTKDNPQIYKTEKYTGDVYSNNQIPPEMLEGWDESGDWLPLRDAIAKEPDPLVKALTESEPIGAKGALIWDNELNNFIDSNEIKKIESATKPISVLSENIPKIDVDWKDATGDVVTGDYVTFTKDILEKKPINRFGKLGWTKTGEETISGKVIKDSYGKDKQQHTFTLLKDDGTKTLVKGRVLYRNGTKRKVWEDENLRQIAAEEKHTRGDQARALRDARKDAKDWSIW